MIEIERLENSQYKYYAEVDGKIYTKNKRTGEITEKSSRINKDGYPEVRVNKKSVRVHRLIAEIFIPCDENIKQLVVNHKDGNKLDNTPFNLEWCSNKANIEHYYKELAKSLEDVLIISKISKEVIDTFKVRSDAVREYGVWVSESVRGNSTYGNLIAVKKSEFEEMTIDEMISKRVHKGYFNNRGKKRKYSQEFIDNLKEMYDKWDGLWTDFCKHVKLCQKTVRTMFDGDYFKDSKLHQKRRRSVVCYYSGLTRITEKYNSKILPPF